MSFLYPPLLFALSAISIPIIVHLFHLRKAKQIQFSHTALLFKTEMQRQKKSKLKHLLILLSRILAIIFLVLAFSQPFIHSEKNTSSISRKAKLIVLDASFSMQLKHDEATAFELGQAYLQTIVEQAAQEQEFYVISGGEFSSSIPYSKKALLENITNLGWDYSDFNVIDSYKKFRQYSPEVELSEVVFISDFQHVGIDSLKNLFKDSTYEFTLVPLIPQATFSNLYVDSVWIEEPLNKIDHKFKLAVSVKNSGNEEKSTTISLAKNKLVLGSAELTLKEGESKILTFNVNSSSELYQSFKLSWEDFPVYADNQFYFTIFNPDQYKVALVQLESETYLNKIYETEPLFQIDAFTPQKIDYKKLEEADLLVFAGVSFENATIESVFKSSLKKEGSVIFIPTKNDKSPFLNQLGYNLVSDTTSHKIKFPSEKDLFFKQVFSKWDSKTAMPTSRNDYSLRGTDPLLEFENESVFVGTKQLEHKKVYFFSSSFESISQQFLKHSLSLPLFFKALYLSKSQNNELFYRVSNRDISLVLQDSLTETPYTLSLESDSLQLIPEQNCQSQLLTMSASAVQKPGIYVLAKNNVTKAYLSFNTALKESELLFPNAEKLEELPTEFPFVTVANIHSKDDVIAFVKEKEDGFPLWKYCIILVLVFLMLEMALVKWLK